MPKCSGGIWGWSIRYCMGEKKWPQILRYALGAAAVLWVNLYIIRDVFHLQTSIRMNSMQGFWVAMARLGNSNWLHPGWWRYCDAGAPFWFIYALFTPGLTALCSKLLAIPVSQAFNGITAAYYVLGPLTLFVFVAWLTRSALTGAAAALCYTLLSPSSLLVPDIGFAFRELLTDRRAYVTGIWDDTPHMGALVILPVFWIFLIRSLRYRKRSDVVVTILLMALETFSSAFGPVLVILSCVVAIFAYARNEWLTSLARVACFGIAAYLIACPALPPSLIASISDNAKTHGDGWDAPALTAISVVVLVWILVWRKLQVWTEDHNLHFAVMLAILTTSIPVLWYYLGRQFVPQPRRYYMEMDLAWALMLPLVVRALWQKLPRNVAAAVGLLLLSLAVEQTVHHRRYVKLAFAPGDITQTLDYQAARFMDENLPAGGRIFAAGSMAPWFNVFSDREQFAGSSYSTAYNQVHQMGLHFLFFGNSPEDPQGAKGVLWLKAFGVQAVTVPGKNSPETWHPFQRPEKFDGLLEPIWNRFDTTIYKVPLRSLSLAHVVRLDSIVRISPKRGDETEGIARFVNDLEDPTLPLATWKWKSNNWAETTAEIRPGQVLSVQVSYDPGWKARINGGNVPVHRDGLGLMWIEPPSLGNIAAELHYEGGREMAACRAASIFGCCLLVVYSLWGLSMSRRIRAQFRLAD
jgi:hypothetical protein